MAEETLDAEVKARVTTLEREAVDTLAAALRTSGAYILRDALTEYFRKRKIRIPATQQQNGKAAA